MKNETTSRCRRSRRWLPLAGVPFALAGAPGGNAGTSPERTLPLDRQRTWQDLELCLVYHFDLAVYLSEGHRQEPARRTALDPGVYRPEALDTDQWLEAAVAAGARYAIFTATHQSGFMQWQTDLYPHGLRQTPWRDGKADIVADFVASCRRVNIRPGIYLGQRFNAWWGVYDHKVNWGLGGDPERQAKYRQVCEKQVEEICSNYGPLCELWFDGGIPAIDEGGPRVLEMTERLQPDMVFYHSPDRAEHRWAGSETGTAAYPCWSTMPTALSQSKGHLEPDQWMDLLKHGAPDGSYWCPAMADAPLRHHEWFWRPDEDHKLHPRDRLVDMYYRSIGHNANLVLGAVPDRNGLIPDADMARLREFGREISRRFDRPLAEAGGAGRVLEFRLPTPARVTQVILMESLEHGERVRRYVVEGLVAADEWRPLCEGVSIGHKRIQDFAPTEVAALRLRILEDTGEPRIRRMAAFDTAGNPLAKTE